MNRIRSLRRPLLLAGALLVLVHLALCIAVAPSRAQVQTILPRWSDHIVTAGLVLIVLAQGIAAASRRGLRRLMPMAILVPVLPVAVVILGFVSLATQRVEIDRITLPDGRLVIMTLEPVPTDMVLALWEPHGRRWRAFLDEDTMTYSEDGSFTDDPRLVVAKDGRHLLIRRGGIWTDCWTTEAHPRSCLPEENGLPQTQEEWLSRSARIATAVGTDPS